MLRTLTTQTTAVSAAAVLVNAQAIPPIVPVAKQAVKKQSAASILSSFTSSQPQKTSITKPTSLAVLPRRSSPPVLESPEQERPRGRGLVEGAAELTKKALPSTKTSFEHFKKQALEKSERVRDCYGLMCSMSGVVTKNTIKQLTTNFQFPVILRLYRVTIQRR